jgi:hypothetical protein
MRLSPAATQTVPASKDALASPCAPPRGLSPGPQSLAALCARRILTSGAGMKWIEKVFKRDVDRSAQTGLADLAFIAYRASQRAAADDVVRTSGGSVGRRGRRRRNPAMCGDYRCNCSFCRPPGGGLGSPSAEPGVASSDCLGRRAPEQERPRLLRCRRPQNSPGLRRCGRGPIG